MAYGERLDSGMPDGCLIGGASTDLVGFYGLTTPIAQGAAVTTVTTTGATSTTNAYGFTTAAQADAVITSLNAIIARVQAIGITA